MITVPSFIPININKFKIFIAKKYKIDICIDGEFIEENIDDNYNYHIYKKGKNKNTLKIYKNRKKQKKNNVSLKELKFNNECNKNKNLVKTEIHVNNKIEDKNFKKVSIDDKNEHLNYNDDIKKKIFNIYNEYKYVINEYNYVNINYKHLKNCYDYLIEKHKNTYNFFVSLVMGLQKIYGEIKSFKLNNNTIKIKEIEHKKILYNIEKIIPKKELILNLNF
jgi:hypothetical protein